jgi:Flp pilus assembly secretin CpaC/tetratricopeptide (TPR) repeat protein
VAVRAKEIGIVGLVLVLAVACWSYGATAAEDATSRLNQAIDRYSALDFATAGQLLRSVDRDALNATDQETLDKYIDHVGDALAQQNEARRRLMAGERALADGDLQRANAAFLQASQSEYLDASSRELANTRLIAVQQQLHGSDTSVLTPDARLVDAQVVVVDSAPASAEHVRPVFDGPVLADAGEATDPVTGDRPSAPDFEETTATAEQVATTDHYAQLLQAGKDAQDEGDLDTAAGLLRQAMMEDCDTTEAESLLREIQKAQLIALGTEGPAVQNVATLVQLEDAPEAEVLPSEMVVATSATVAEVQPDDTDEAVSNTLNQTIAMRTRQKEQAEVVYNLAVKRANQSLAIARTAEDDDSDYIEAESFRLQAQAVLDERKHLFTDDELRNKQEQLDNLETSIANQKRQWNEARKQKMIIAEIEAEKERIAEQEKTKRERLNKLQLQAQNLMLDGNFEAALDTVDKMLELDPQNPYALTVQMPLQGFLLEQEEYDVRTESSYQLEQHRLRTLEESILWYDELIYPDNWVELSRRRLDAIDSREHESEEDRRVYQELKKKYSRFEFDDVDLATVIDYFTKVSGVSFHVKWHELELAGIDPDRTTVKIYLRNVTLDKALRTVLEDVGRGNPLGFYVDDGVITISTKDDLSTNTTVQTYDIADLLVRVQNFAAPRLNLSLSGSTSVGGDLFTDEGEDEEISREDLIEEVKNLIEDSIDRDSWGDEASIEEISGQLVITQTAENHQAIRDLLNQLRESRAIQVIIESRFIEVDTSFLERVGIDLDVYFNIGSKWASQDYYPPGENLAEDQALGYPNFRGGDDPEYMWTQNQGADRWSGSTIQRINRQHNAQSNSWTPIAVETGNKLNWVTAATGVGMDIGSATMATPTAFSVAGAFLDDIEVDFLMEATQGSVTRRVLTAPRLTLFNGQRAYISVATQSSYVQSWDTRVAQGTTSLSPVLGYVPTGSVLDVEANVSHDRRYVTLTVKPQVAELIAFRDPIAFNGGIGTSGTIELPEVRVKELKTTVSVPDGGTLMLGGQKLAGVMEREVGPPVLSKVPVINRLFTGRGLTQDETTLLILVRPQIIIQREEEENAHP